MKTRYTILILCEGQNTEPSFFQSIYDIIISGEIILAENPHLWIVPNPKDDVDNEGEDSIHKKKRQRRELRPAIDKKLEPLKESYPHPLNWIIQAKEALSNGSADEAWAVFDNDHSPGLLKAYEESQKPVGDKFVHIGFSSICFEYYLLLNFERIFHDFQTSECSYKLKEKKKRKPIYCNGRKSELGDCRGKKCVGGYARIQGYWERSKGNSLYPLIKDKLKIGYENCEWLRFISNKLDNTKPYTLKNPYITVDNLVKRLTGENRNWKWIDVDQAIIIQTLVIRVNSTKSISIINKGNNSVLIERNAFSRISSNEERLTFGERLIIYPFNENDPRTNYDIDLSNHADNQDDWFMLSMENNLLMFSFTLSRRLKLEKLARDLLSLTHRNLEKLIISLKERNRV